MIVVVVIINIVIIIIIIIVVVIIIIIIAVIIIIILIHIMTTSCWEILAFNFEETRKQQRIIPVIHNNRMRPRMQRVAQLSACVPIPTANNHFDAFISFE